MLNKFHTVKIICHRSFFQENFADTLFYELYLFFYCLYRKFGQLHVVLFYSVICRVFGWDPVADSASCARPGLGPHSPAQRSQDQVDENENAIYDLFFLQLLSHFLSPYL
jgi:hypothetical protein